MGRSRFGKIICDAKNKFKSYFRSSPTVDSNKVISPLVFNSVYSALIIFGNFKFSSLDAFKGVIMILKSKKVFSNHQTWHVAHVAQLAARPRSPHSRHTQPWTSFTRSETGRWLPTPGSSPNQNQYKAELPKFQVQWSAGGHCRGCRRWETRESAISHGQLSPGSGVSKHIMVRRCSKNISKP